VAFQAVGVWVAAEHHRPQQRVTILHCRENGLTKGLRKELHFANFIGNRHVPTFYRLSQRRDAHALHLIDVYPILGYLHRTRMPGRRQESHVPIERHDPESLADTPALQILRVETGGSEMHAGHHLADQCCLAATGLAGHQIGRFQTLTLRRNRYPIADKHNGTSIGESRVKQRVFGSQSTRPWSPLSVSLITFILPAGGAVLTIQNLARLQIVNSLTARRQAVGVVLLYGLGFAIILALAPVQADGVPRLDAGTYSVVQFGFAAAAYLVQRGPFRAWVAKQTSGTSHWTSGVLTAVIYQLLATVITVPIYAGVAAFISSAGTP
jgi:hypothetical protein